jgi:phage anti-repressor protein
MKLNAHLQRIKDATSVTKKYYHKITWIAKTQHVDIETGEIITKTQYKNATYIKITTAKDITVNPKTNKGTIIYTILCRKNPQLRLI